MTRSFRLLALAALLPALSAAVSGCATNRSALSANLLGEGGDEPAFFSDETSLSQVLATKELLALQREEYKVGPDDVVDVSIFEWEANDQTKTLELRVSEAGVISLPSIGAIEVAGKSVQEIQKLIEDTFVERGVLQSPRVGVWVSEFRSRRISVIGAVHQPGSYAIHQNVSTLLDILSLAGGPQESAGGIAYVVRAARSGRGGERIKIDLDELLEKGDATLNPVLGEGDVVYIPKAPLIYVYGAVKQAGAFTFRKQLRLLEALALAGGVNGFADKTDVTLIRRSEDGGERVYAVNIGRIESGKEPNIFLRDNDVIRVKESPAKRVGYEIYTFLRGIFTFTYRLDGNN